MPQTPTEAAQYAWVMPAVIGALTVVLAAWLVRRGDFDARGFADAPRRDGELRWFDLAIGLGLWVLGGAVGGLIGKALAPADNEAASGLYVVVAGAAGALPAVAFVIARAATQMRDGVAGIGFRLRGPGGGVGTMVGGAALAVLATLAALSATKLVADALGVELPTVAHETLTAIRDGGPTERALLIAVACVVAPVVEETLFRGLFQTVLRQQAPWLATWAVVAIPSGLFAAIHLSLVPWPALIGLGVLGLLLGWLYERTGRLWLVMGVHAAFNAINVAIAIGLGDQVGG